MKDQPHWMELCQQASVEQDPEKLMELIQEINRLLDEKEERLRLERSKKTYPALREKTCCSI
jgi:hypothetical protein